MNQNLTKPEISPAITEAEWREADTKYRPNCGPSALAVMARISLLRACEVIPGFAERHYTNPTMMMAALRALGVGFQERDDSDCEGHTLTRYGLVRLQWEGPWTAPGANPKWAYRHTHWVGAAEFAWPAPEQLLLFVFDVNCGWQTFEDWKGIYVPNIIAECVDPRATGNWWATHRLELDLSSKLGGYAPQGDFER